MPPPENLQVAWESDRYPPVLKVTWRETYTANDGYDVECKAGDGAFTNIFGNPMVPLAMPQFYIGFGSFGETMPEAVDLQYRMRYVRYGKRSQYSNTATVRAPIRPPRVVSHPQESGPGLVFTWINVSQAADTLIIERAVGDTATTLGAWTPVPGPAFGATSFLDADRPEAPWVAYRVVYQKGNDKGSNLFGPVQNPLKAPAGFQATPGIGFVDLAWTNPGSQATELVVMRQDRFGDTSTWVDIAHLPPTATSYRDASLVNAYNAYRVETRQAGRISGKTPTLGTAAVPEPKDGLAFATSVQTLPHANNGQMDTQGRWSFAGINWWEDGYFLWIPEGGGWAGNPVRTIATMPVLRLDSHGHAHAVLNQRDASSTTEEVLAHVWHDGTAWQREEVARRPIINSSSDQTFAFALDEQDRLHVIWMDSTTLRQTALHSARKEADGRWVRLPDADLSTTRDLSLSTLILALAQDGTPVVLVNADMLTYNGTSGWSISPLPGLYYVRQVETSLLREPDGRIDLIRVGNQTLEVRSYASGAWTPAEAFLSAAGFPGETFTNPRLTAAISPSGNRLVVGLAGSAGTYLAIREGGIWKTIRLGSGSNICPMVGFLADDRIQVLHQADPYPLGDTCSFAVFTETR